MLLIREYEDYLFGFSAFDKGTCPDDGGWQDQEYHWIMAFRIIEPAVISMQIDNLKRQQEEQQPQN